MTLDEAIEIKKRQKEGYTTYSKEVIDEADRLGVEGLERLKENRTLHWIPSLTLLPGETKD